MHPNRSQRRVHSAEFKTQVLAECRQPGASVAAVAIAHGLNPNIVRKWLAGRNLKRMVRSHAFHAHPVAMRGACAAVRTGRIGQARAPS